MIFYFFCPLLAVLVLDTEKNSFSQSFTCFNTLMGETQQRTFGFRQTGLLLERPGSLYFHGLYISAWQSKFRNYSVCVKQMSFAHKYGRFSDFFHYFSVSPLFPSLRKLSEKKIHTQKFHETIFLRDRCHHGAQLSVVLELNDFCLSLHLSVAMHLQRRPCKSLTGVGERAHGDVATSGPCADLVE